jgi:hypothetical protein
MTDPRDRLLTIDEKEPQFEPVDEWGPPSEPVAFWAWLRQSGIPGMTLTDQLRIFMTYPAAKFMPPELRAQLGVDV